MCEIPGAKCWLFSPAGFRYVTCQIHNCSEKMPTAPFPGPIDHSSLTVQDDYIFFRVSLLLGVLAAGSRQQEHSRTGEGGITQTGGNRLAV